MNLPIHERLIHATNNSPIRIFWDVILIALWEIWKIRNKIFLIIWTLL
jgi:hypothetical protein